jgi:type IV pilus assembly protein PilY1
VANAAVGTSGTFSREFRQMRRHNRFALLAVALVAGFPAAGWSQALTVSDDFTKSSDTSESSIGGWATFDGACLTAGDGTGSIPACVGLPYYQGQTLVGGYNGTLPDSSGNGALRFTNGFTTGHTSGFAYGFNQAGGIISNFTFDAGQGVNIIFKTVTYRGNSGGNGGSGTVSANDGADGMSFYLINAVGGANPPYDMGAFGGSLGYSCSNSNNDPTLRADGTPRGYDGLVGAYLGLGIDEFGNFLNPSDNTASGPGLQADRIGLRGGGSISWAALNAAYSNYYPPTLTASQRTDAVKATCQTGTLWDFSASTTSTEKSKQLTDKPILDYPAISGGYKVLVGTLNIANEGALTRQQSMPVLPAQPTLISYNLQITQNGLLSLSYSTNGGAYQSVLTNQDLTTVDGPLPGTLRFGFAGSTGGSNNIHEILCFQATPNNGSTSSGAVTVYENPTLLPGTETFLAFYNPSDWTGQLEALAVGFDTTHNVITINPTPLWDARCVLSGASTTNPCSTGSNNMTAQGSASRTIITWDTVGKVGIPFEWTSLNSAQQAALGSGDASVTLSQERLAYLRGDTTNQVNAAGVGLFRARDAILGDIMDSSPTWIGPPQLPYQNVTSWTDLLNTTTAQPENASGAQTYANYQTSNQGRMNVVYVGANDGFLHAFRAGQLDAGGNLVNSGTNPNDGREIFAYIPGASIAGAVEAVTKTVGTTTTTTNYSVVDTVHGTDPTNSNTVNPSLDYANTQYGHNYFVDAPPATGDVFYSNAWHTWLVGGLGAGGALIYAINVTDPYDQFAVGVGSDSSAQKEAVGATSIVGEWSAANISCSNNSGCATHLGQTFGTPEIRRFHNGQWGAIIGNGLNSVSDDAGIFLMLINSSGTPSFLYLGTNTGSPTAPNGIVEAGSVDLDGDHIVDYIYAGDLQGNIWRFDVTSTSTSNWNVRSAPLFNAGSGQPITTRVTVGTLKTISTTTNAAGAVLSNAPERVIIGFGTGQMVPQTLAAPTQYATGQQYLYGIWDWDFNTTVTGWNAISAGQKTIALNAPQTITGPATGSTNLQVQTISAGSAAGTRTVSKTPICWEGSGTCTSMGWYIALPGPQEQIIFDPVLTPDGEFTVNTFIPGSVPLTSCKVAQSTGWSMAVDAQSGGGSPVSFFSIGGSGYDGVQLNGVGIPAFISSGQAADHNSEYMLTQTPNGPATPTKINRHVIVTGQRVNWIERR